MAKRPMIPESGDPPLPEDAPAHMTDILGQQQMLFGHPATMRQDDDDDDGAEHSPSDALPPEEPASPTPAPEDEWHPKYANQREAERAQTEAQRRMTEAAQEAADLRRQLAEREERERELSEQLQLLQRPATPQTPAEDEQPFDVAAYIQQNGYNVASQLDPNLDDYNERSQAIVAKAQADAIRLYWEDQNKRAQHHTPALQPDDIRNIIREELTTQQQQQQEQQQVKSVYQQLLSAASAAGLDVREPDPNTGVAGLHYHDLVAIARANRRPRGEEQEAIRETVETVQKRFNVSKPAAPPAPPAPAATNGVTHPAVRPQVPPSPMERSTGHVPQPQPDVLDERQLHMDEILELAQGNRVIGGR